jgi:hypothetical protein
MGQQAPNGTLKLFPYCSHRNGVSMSKTKPPEMSQWRLSLYLCCCIMVLGQPALSQSAAATDSIKSSHARLLAIDDRLSTITYDLEQVFRALDSRDGNRLIISSLQGDATATRRLLLHAGDMLFLYQNMSSAKDRETVESYVRLKLKQLVGSLEDRVKFTNDWIEDTNRPEIVNKATELKNAIRQSIDVLNAVKL